MIGCDGDHILLQCEKLLNMELSERKEVLEKSGLCLFCLKHAADWSAMDEGASPSPGACKPDVMGNTLPACTS